MVDRIGDWHAAGHRHQTPGRLETDDPAPGRRGPNGPALVATERQLDLAGGDQRGAATRRPTGGMLGAVRVTDGTGRTRMATGGETKVLTGRLAGNDPARVKH